VVTSLLQVFPNFDFKNLYMNITFPSAICSIHFNSTKLTAFLLMKLDEEFIWSCRLTHPSAINLMYVSKFYVIMTVHFGMNLYNNQRNVQVFYLSIYYCLTCFGLSFSPSSETGVQLRQWFKTLGYGVSARALTPYPRDLNHCRN
jgi:hypothetical protein